MGSTIYFLISFVFIRLCKQKIWFSKVIGSSTRLIYFWNSILILNTLMAPYEKTQSLKVVGLIESHNFHKKSSPFNVVWKRYDDRLWYALNMLLKLCIKFLNILKTINENSQNWNVVDLTKNYNFLLKFIFIQCCTKKDIIFRRQSLVVPVLLAWKRVAW